MRNSRSLIAKSLKHKSMNQNLIFMRFEGQGYKLLAHGFGRYRHPQDSATLSQTAYTYYFAQAITRSGINLQLLALRIKHLAHSSPPNIYKTAQSFKQKDPHPLFNFLLINAQINRENTPSTKKGTLLARAVYFLSRVRIPHYETAFHIAK